MVDPRGVTRYEYDVARRMTKVTEPDGKFVTYAYDATGRRTQMIDHFGGTTTYAYDNDGREIRVIGRDGGITTFVYDADGNRTQMTHPNGMVADYFYDSRNRLLTLNNHKDAAHNNEVIAKFDYTYDAVGDRLSVTEDTLDIDNTAHHSATVNYGYDALYRLTSEHRTGYTPYWNEYDYDPVGNRLEMRQKDDAGNITGTTDYTYNNVNEMLTAGNISFAYDANGNQATKTVNGVTTTMTWDFRNKMLKYYDGVAVGYRYDGDGTRIYKKNVSSGVETNYIFDRNLGLSQLLFEVDSTGTPTVAYNREVSGALISQTRALQSASTTSYYAFEAIGTTRALTDAAQAVSDTYVFDAWGNELARQGNVKNAFVYRGMLGYYYDEETGLMLLGARWYSGASGIFLSSEQYVSFRYYQYAAANPITLVDPAGTWPHIPWDCGKYYQNCETGGRILYEDCCTIINNINTAVIDFAKYWAEHFCDWLHSEGTPISLELLCESASDFLIDDVANDIGRFISIIPKGMCFLIQVDGAIVGCPIGWLTCKGITSIF